MSGLTTARWDLVARLNQMIAGVDFFAHVPEAIQPPCGIVQPGTPYVDRTELAADDWDITLDLFLLVPIASNEQAADDLDALIGACETAIAGTEWWPVAVDAPGVIATGLWEAHGLKMTIRTNIQTL